MLTPALKSQRLQKFLEVCGAIYPKKRRIDTRRTTPHAPRVATKDTVVVKDREHKNRKRLT